MLNRRKYVHVGFGIFVVSFIGGCSSRSPEPVAQQLIYYPQKNTYFDEQNSFYYYSLDGGISWDSLENNQANAAVVGLGIPVERPGGQVWNDNSNHLRTFKGRRINIINEQTLLLAKEDSIGRIKTVAKAAPAPVKAVEEEAPKKGIKKFFNKLFGKKNKSNSEKSSN